MPLLRLSHSPDFLCVVAVTALAAVVNVVPPFVSCKRLHRQSIASVAASTSEKKESLTMSLLQLILFVRLRT